MSKTSQQHDLTVLSSNKNGLVYLSANDWALIADKAVRRQFKTGDLIVQQGRRTHGLFVLLKGTAVVQVPPIPSRVIEAGEVCGEISFLDELPATAHVIASTEVEALFLDRSTLVALFELFPHLGSRFYHSLSAVLSRRLRGTISIPAQASKGAS
jgi:CRP-like cAMP-binding protein